MKEPQQIVVLNDGETYTSLQGCSIWFVNESGLELLDQGYSPRQLSEEDVERIVEIVQVQRDALRGKSATLSSFISIPGRCLT